MFKKTKNRYFLYLSILIGLGAWAYRLYKIHLIILQGHLFDFFKLFYAARELVSGGESSFIAGSSYGSPQIYAPYFPLTLLSFKSAEYIITIISLIAYFVVIYKYWKEHYSRTNIYFWLFLGFLAFSFPIIYSLGMGNPIGLVLLGIYGLFIFGRSYLSGFFYGLASMMKLFPLIIFPFLVFDEIGKKSWKLSARFARFIVAFLGVSVIIVLSVPNTVWRSYFSFISGVLGKVATGVDLTAYNQSFSSAISRLGLTVYSFSPEYFIFVGLLLLVFAFYTYHQLKEDRGFDARFYLFLIAFTLLIHPFPWQYYYAIFIPFLMVKIYKREFRYLIVFLLLSWDGNRFQVYQPLTNFLLGSQFFGTLFFYLLVGLGPVYSKYIRK